MFSEKYGYKSEKPIQHEWISDELRNRIWNLFFRQEIQAGGLASKRLSQALNVVGDELGFKKLNFHMARHSFAVLALNGGLAMSVVSRLLGHGSTDVTEKVYAKFLPETLASEVEKIKVDVLPDF